MTATGTGTWLERARGMGDAIAKYRDEAERARRMPAALHNAMLGAGLFGMTLSKTYGGSQASVVDCIRASRRLRGMTGLRAGT